MVEQRLRTALHWAEKRWDRARFTVKKHVGLLGTPILEPYHGMDGPDGYWLRGRVMEDQGIIDATPSASTLRNVWQTYRRYETDEIHRAQLRWVVDDQSGIVRTDREGYFDLVVPHGPDASEGPWRGVALELLDAPGYEFAPIGAKAEVRVVSPQATFGVISDIDDTIIKTGAFNFLKHWRTVVANSAESRTAFAGVSPFYRALAKGAAGPETNPIYYVSSSPWNLFDLFDRFLMLHDIPKGPMLLKDFGLTSAKWMTGGHDGHKLQMIGKVMDANPQLNFVLIGDSGQDDGAIYAEAARRHPGRVIEVHLRDVTTGDLDTHIEAGIADLRDMGIPLTVSPTLSEPARQARDAGLIREEDVAEIDADIAAREKADRAGA